MQNQNCHKDTASGALCEGGLRNELSETKAIKEEPETSGDSEARVTARRGNRVMHGEAFRSNERNDSQRHCSASEVGVSDTGCITYRRERHACSSLRTAEVPAKVIELYICSICGITNETNKNWGPTCRMTGRRVCDRCCYECEHHISWSGIWRCGYITPQDRHEDIQRRIRDKFEEENIRISKAYHRKRKEEARKRAIKNAKARKKQSKTAGGANL